MKKFNQMLQDHKTKLLSYWKRLKKSLVSLKRHSFSFVFILVLFVLSSLIAGAISPALLGAYHAILLVSLVTFPFIAYFMARNDLLFTLVLEGRAKVIMKNDGFYSCIMNFKKHRFRGDSGLSSWEKKQKVYLKSDGTIAKGRTKREETEDEKEERLQLDRWDVIQCDEGQEDNGSLSDYLGWIPFAGKWLDGVYFIGIPPFYSLHEHRMEWVSWEYPHDDKGMVTGTEKAPRPRSEPHMEHILIQDDIYFVRMSKVETVEGLPVNMGWLLTIGTKNPYKALFRSQQWHELVTNQFESDAREFVGTREYNDLFTNKEAVAEELKQTLSDQLGIFANRYGIDVKRLQLQSVDPDDRLRDLTLKKYEGEQEAKLLRTKAEGERDRLEKTVGYVAEDPARAEIYKWQQVGSLKNLQVLSMGEKNPGVLAGVQLDKKTKDDPTTSESE